jgi:hypothetical protein
VGSLSPTFVSARRVGLTVKLPCAFTLDGWFPFSLREPLGASVTLSQATAPVKLPTCQGPEGRSGPRLGCGLYQAGIPRSARPRLASRRPCLPAILHRYSPHAVASCSKAPRGLFVLLRVLRILTQTSISPGPSLRQCPTRYTIRAGRNLPDKEFRYLRTVIVTAAVHRGFDSKLHPEGLTSPLNLPAPGRCQPLYVGLRLGRDLCFC